MDTEVIDIWTAVRDASGSLLGVLRISKPLETLTQDLMRVRGFMVAIMVVGLLVGALIGLGLAVSMENPLQQMTYSLQGMAREEHPNPIELEGPEEFKALASAFNHLVNRIQEMETTRKKLLANLVHELGRPLGALRAAIHALEQGAAEDPELGVELLEGMDTQSRDLERLVQDLTHLYDESMGRFELKLEHVDYEEWLRGSVATWKAHARQKDQRIEVQADDLPQMTIDPNRMSQALGNLLSNAIKFTPRGGCISVKASAHETEIVIRVQDTGPGLSENDLQNIFSPFYRGDQGTRFPKGMGLGLSIARDIIHSHQGSLEAENVRSQGSRFTIRLPIH
jgi:signal transduction histidine kinase